MSFTTRSTMIAAAALCVAVAAIHVDDQGGVTAFADPDWLGWAYRLLELGAIAVAGALVFTAGTEAAGAANAARAKLVWVSAALIGAGPFVGFVLTRTTGLPGDSDDIGNWGETLGIVSLVVEGLLVLIAIGGLLSRQRVSVLMATGVVAAGTLAACSSSASTPHDTSPASPPAGSHQSAGSGSTVTATETEFHISLSSTQLKPGTYTFKVKNAGKITHALSIDGSGVNKSTSDISPGSSASLTVTLKSGKYDVFCPVGDHKMEGMDETVQVG